MKKAAVFGGVLPPNAGRSYFSHFKQKITGKRRVKRPQTGAKAVPSPPIPHRLPSKPLDTSLLGNIISTNCDYDSTLLGIRIDTDRQVMEWMHKNE
ncbi:MAG: hypothetical protein HFJ86_08515 [Oscillospiraceae bacterium]|jgi:hypothetical protein|nr:hypothetical protein [Oscillospiraceae bacterium]